MRELRCLRYFYILCFVLLFGAFFGLHTAAYAQQIVISPHLGTQDLFSNQIPIDLAITSNVDINQLKVQWIIPYGLNKIPGEALDYSTQLVSTDITRDHIIVVPQTSGIFSVTANVSGIYQGTAFSRSASVYVDVDSNLNLKDNSALYTTKHVIYILLSIIFFVFFLFLLKGVYNKLRTQFHIWLNKES